jgi:hypothetical protein
MSAVYLGSRPLSPPVTSADRPEQLEVSVVCSLDSVLVLITDHTLPPRRAVRFRYHRKLGQIFLNGLAGFKFLYKECLITFWNLNPCATAIS